MADDDCGVVVMGAALGSEEAGERRDLRHGTFFLALTAGLSSKADTNQWDGHPLVRPGQAVAPRGVL